MISHYFHRHFILWQALSIFHASSYSVPSLQTVNTPSASNLLLPVNNTLSGNFSAARTPNINCAGGPDYGDSIRRESCQNAADEILENLYFSGKRVLEFKERGSQGGVFLTDVVLPYLSLSCR